MREVGIVTLEERDIIESLFEKKVAIENLLKIVPEEDMIKEKLLKDYKVIDEKYCKWWYDLSNKYNWKKVSKSYWTIDFQSRKIYLLMEQDNGI